MVGGIERGTQDSQKKIRDAKFAVRVSRDKRGDELRVCARLVLDVIC